jgi:hypothetical protein
MISDLAQAIPVPKHIADGSTSRRNLHLRSKDGDNVERSTHSCFAVYAFTVAIIPSKSSAEVVRDGFARFIDRRPECVPPMCMTNRH